MFYLFNPIALRKAKIVYNFGFSGCSRVKLTDSGVKTAMGSRQRCLKIVYEFIPLEQQWTFKSHHLLSKWLQKEAEDKLDHDSKVSFKF